MLVARRQCQAAVYTLSFSITHLKLDFERVHITVSKREGISKKCKEANKCFRPQNTKHVQMSDKLKKGVWPPIGWVVMCDCERSSI